MPTKPSTESVVLLFAIVFQVLAALRAFVLIRATHNWRAWGLIGGALLLLAWRTVLLFFQNTGDWFEMSSTLISALIIWGISVLLVAGLYFISPILTSIKKSEEALEKSESRYRSLINNMLEGVALHELIVDEHGTPVDYRIIAVNPAFTTITGIDGDSAIGARGTILFGTGEAPYLDTYARVVETGETFSFETYFPPMEKHFNISVFTPAIGQFATIFEDVTERLRSEEDLRFAQFALDSASDSIILVDDAARVIYVNNAACTELGYSRDELLEMQVQDFDIRFVPERWPAQWQEYREHGASTYESLHLTKDGRIIPVEVTGNFLQYQGKEFICKYVRDITERKRTEEELRASEERFRTSMENMLDAFGIFSAVRDEDGHIVDFAVDYLNASACAVNGVALDDAIGRHFTRLFPRQQESGLYDAYSRVVEIGDPLVLSSVIEPGDPSRNIPQRVFDIQAVKLRDGFIVSWRDVTERHRFQEQLHAETERLAITLRSIGDGVITSDRAGCVLLMNRVAEELTGWTQEEAIGRPLAEVFHIIDEYSGERVDSPVERVLRDGAIIGLNSHPLLMSRDGAEYILNDSGAPVANQDGEVVGVVLVFRDVTEKRRLESELQRAAKLESLGILAGGIAHDFNNVLTAILGNLSLARVLASSTDPVFPKLIEAEKAALHAKDLTQQILTFSRGGTPLKKVISLADLIRETTAFALSGTSVACEMTLDEALWPAEVDPGQITQVIHNLIVNADQAMCFAGEITITAQNAVVPRDDNMLPLDPGSYVRITVEDEGTGIEPEDLPKIFDPFFTTKPSGSGLGLATAYSIVRNHNGCILVDSEVDIGTTFTIYLPASPDAVLPTVKPVEESTGQLHCGRILAMDDESLVLETVEAMLEVLGYEVTAVDNGEEAITAYESARGFGYPYDAVLLDLTMRGGIGGKEVMERLLDIDPAVKAIVSSGYSNDPIMADYRQYGFSGVIAKPYKVSELSEVLRGVIAEEAALAGDE